VTTIIVNVELDSVYWGRVGYKVIFSCDFFVNQIEVKRDFEKVDRDIINTYQISQLLIKDCQLHKLFIVPDEECNIVIESISYLRKHVSLNT
jgi:hypothetical protein